MTDATKYNVVTWVWIVALFAGAWMVDAAHARQAQRFNIWRNERSGDIIFSLVNDGVAGRCWVVTYEAHGYGAGAAAFGPVPCE